MKQVKFFAIAAIAVIALASCQKMENVGYNSDSGMQKEPSETVKAVKLAAPQEPQIVAISFSVVPAHKDEDNNIFVDGKGAQAPSKCFLIEYSNGYKVVIFDSKEIFPSVEQIENSPLLENIEKMPEYNSAYFNGEAWLPAFAEDVYSEGEFVALRYTSESPIPRTVRKETLLEWQKEGSWENEFTTRLDGYTVTVNDGYVEVSCGESTLTIS